MTTACSLPDGRTVALAGEVADRLACGVVVVSDVGTGDQDRVQASIAALGETLRAEHEGRLPSQIEGLGEARRLYKSFGMDPSRHRPSSEALLRRVLKGQGLYRISAVVDTCNLASLEFLLPIGMYDLAKVQGAVTLRVGAPGDEYPGIRKGPVHLEGRLGLFDEAGPFGSPTSDSARTCTDETSTDLLAVVMATAAYPAEKLAEHARRFGDLMVAHAGGSVLMTGVLTGAGTS